MKKRLFLYTALIIFAGLLSLFVASVYVTSYINNLTPAPTVSEYLFRLLPILIFLLIVLTWLSFLFIRRIVNKIVIHLSSVEQKLWGLSNNSNGGHTPDYIGRSYEEIDKITREIDDDAFILQKDRDSLRNEKNKLDYIINNIGDGLFVLDENKTVVLINSAALGIFSVTPDIIAKHLNYLCYENRLTEAVEDCVNLEKNALFELTLNGNIYLVTVKRLPDTVLTTVVLSNVTENRESAKQREEFFANASHELKTPLTAIKGFTELTAMNNKDENINKYIASITRETDRMLSLIGDMLKLSELENSKNMKYINSVLVSLAKVVNEVHETESTAIGEKSIIFETSGDYTVQADPSHVYELVKNLIENAVRYNNLGGRVSVIIENGKKIPRLIVSDDGIGISPEEQTRIFERFYRVEKSRSQRNGGTGLGLSIVKHICALYDWKLSLKSKLGVGTEIMVVFDANYLLK
ncbi:MAG: ATP-binding protein [Oscillospiraceae bacterium]|nr:ATP-binding protein [Oscillospiraceae bacterium]